MPEIKPFRGILYDTTRVEIANVVAPPYDVISPALQTELYAKDPHNVVRLILNKEENPYPAAAAAFSGWKKERVLVQDEIPAIYVLAQSFPDADGNEVERWGFIAACKLEDFGKGSIYPHEKTLSGPREDRFRLFQSTDAMFSQIFGLYSDPKRSLDAATRSVLAYSPHADVRFDGVRNRLWKLTGERERNLVASFLRDEKVLIADGHHRYETALLYRDSRRMKNPGHTGTEPYNFVPMFFTNMHDPGLIIYPTHRLVHSIPGFQPEPFLRSCEEFFTIATFGKAEEMLAELRKSGKGAFGVVAGTPAKYMLLSAKPGLVSKVTGALPVALADLDVTVLHSVILKKILGMSDEAQEKKLYLEYEKDARKAVSSVETGAMQAAFIMNPTRIAQVRGVASAGMVMPQKSTFFYPKILSGLVIYSFGSEGEG